MRRFLLVAVMCGAASVAQAADMPDLPFLRGSFTEGLSSATVNWQGYYVGGQVELRLQRPRRCRPRPTATCKRPSCRPTSVELQSGCRWASAHGNTTGFGGFVGYNSQWEDVVVGVEANYIHDGFRSDSQTRSGCGIIPTTSRSRALTHSNAAVKLSDFGSLRVRGGYVMGCFLPYLFAGTGFGSQTVDRAVSAYPGIRLRAGRTYRRQQDQAGLWILRRRSAST